MNTTTKLEGLTPGKMLKMWRVEREKSQTDLARILGTSQQVISNIESGDTLPKFDFIKLVQIKCGLDLTQAEMPGKCKIVQPQPQPNVGMDAFALFIEEMVERRVEEALAERKGKKNYRSYGGRTAFKQPSNLS